MSSVCPRPKVMSGYQSEIEAITNGNKGTKKQLRRKNKEGPPEGRRGFASIGLLGRGHSPQSEAHIPQVATTPSTTDPIGRKRRRLVAAKPLHRSADKAGECVPEPPHHTSLAQSIQLVRSRPSSRYRAEVSTCTFAQLCVHLLCTSTAVCTFVQQCVHLLSIRIQLRIQYLPNTGKGVCTFAQ